MSEEETTAAEPAADESLMDRIIAGTLAAGEGLDTVVRSGRQLLMYNEDLTEDSRKQAMALLASAQKLQADITQLSMQVWKLNAALPSQAPEPAAETALEVPDPEQPQRRRRVNPYNGNDDRTTVRATVRVLAEGETSACQRESETCAGKSAEIKCPDPVCRWKVVLCGTHRKGHGPNALMQAHWRAKHEPKQLEAPKGP